MAQNAVNFLVSSLGWLAIGAFASQGGVQKLRVQKSEIVIVKPLQETHVTTVGGNRGLIRGS